LRHGCVLLFCVCAALCAGSVLAMGWSPAQGILLTVKSSRNWKSGQGPTKGCKAIDWTDGRMDRQVTHLMERRADGCMNKLLLMIEVLINRDSSRILICYTSFVPSLTDQRFRRHFLLFWGWHIPYISQEIYQNLKR
jgi:hypothetical protein